MTSETIIEMNNEFQKRTKEEKFKQTKNIEWLRGEWPPNEHQKKHVSIIARKYTNEAFLWYYGG